MGLGTISFPRLLEGNVDRLCALLRERYETSVSPGRFFGAEDHFRVGISCPTDILQEGLARLSEALDQVAGSRDS